MASPFPSMRTAPARSAPEPVALRVVERCLADHGGHDLAADLDAPAVAGSSSPWIQASPADPPSVGAIAAARDVARGARRRAAPTRRATARRRARARETSRRSRGASRSAVQRLAAHEVGGLLQVHREPEPALRTGRRAGRCRGPRSGSRARSARRRTRTRPACRSPRSAPAATTWSYRSATNSVGTLQLPAELARVRDPERPRLRPPDLDLARREERERLVREVLVGEAREQLARPRAGDVERRPSRS